MAELVLSPPPISLPHYGFVDFLQIFLLGDTSRLLAGSPRGEASFVGEDTVKTTMLLQAIRHMPILTTIPLSITIVLCVATLAKAVVPLLSLSKERKRREAVEFEEEKENGGESWVLQLAHRVDKILEDLQMQEMPEDDEKEKPLKLGRSNGIQGLVELGGTLTRLLEAFVDMMPAVGGCVGAMVGCVVRLNFVGTVCLPFAPLAACARLVGNTVQGVLGSLEESKSGFT